MAEFTKSQVKMLNRKKGELRLTYRSMAKEIGISEITLANILNERVITRIRKPTVLKVNDWLSEHV
ncbi:hypothetical protein FPFC_060920 [Fructobacillus pseudoficulneus]|uniref:HTH cro/C1-type domain-containing protein n=1 Tax=Fructobacillus pseudoficulneus TaxID=220714 RepID=A0A3F3HAH0_9LACO|nr:hypothetical protein [Fructobacillus pseudoficulneus]GAP03369.1 hypothetical protein FPFC_060920 [Fructobacillus pseudoficulneus]SEH43717.1 hypothetical protein SAMN05660469_1062 [Fructobacillus pseudoficulneus]